MNKENFPIYIKYLLKMILNIMKLKIIIAIKDFGKMLIYIFVKKLYQKSKNIVVLKN